MVAPMQVVPPLPAAVLPAKLQTGKEILDLVKELAANDPERIKVTKLRNVTEQARVAAENYTRKAGPQRAQFTDYKDYVDAYTIWNNEYKRLSGVYDDAKTKLYAANFNVNEKIKQLLKFPTPATLTLDVISKGKKLQAQQVEGVAWVESIINPDIVPDKTKFGTQIQYNKKGGAFYRRKFGSNKSIIEMDSADVETIVHELGHFIDEETIITLRLDANTTYQRKTANQTHRFYRERTVGDSFEQLKKEFPVFDYKPQDRFKRDKWRTVYTGRDYNVSDASEILSTGLEFLYMDAVGFSEFDPQHFEVVVNAIRGIETP